MKGLEIEYFGIHQENSRPNDTDTETEWQSIENNFTSEYMLSCRTVYDRIYPFQRFFLNFSFLSNAYSLTSQRGSDDKGLAILNGVRVLSILWVLTGHCFSGTGLGSPIILNSVKRLVDNFPFLMISNGDFSVDTFFFIGGLLAAFVLSIKMSKMTSSQSVKTVPMSYVHRYLRLTPLMLVVILVSWKLVPYFGSGPLWHGTHAKLIGDQACDKYWWTNIVYINNVYPSSNESTCLTQLWYTANDMQFFLITPFLLIIYLFVNKTAGVLSIMALCIASWIHIWILTYQYHFAAYLDTPDNQHQDYYFSPLTRVPVYLLGVLFGLAYYEYRKNGKFVKFVDVVNSKRWVRLLFYAVGITLTSFVIFSVWPLAKDYGTLWDDPTNAAYLSFGRSGFVLGMAFFLLPVVLGHNTFVRNLLDNYLMVPLSRLTYGVYLTQLTVITWFWGTQQYGFEVTYMQVFYIAIGTALTCFLISAVLYLLVEIPMARLERTYLMPSKKTSA
eukprot:CAMPEP_0115016484 /NCGR_PEP_ID=MMETSP0216-20121206/27472_1 /TAXON_ID=223996 /ORGANISM="Protocruzia adherens, Strain Boccale" /LENGTH=499 /DNA_ID=CAMNT_0002386965 /DNA_START=29 /DNA_END=1528 /DNA_ORIENTATION=-